MQYDSLFWFSECIPSDAFVFTEVGRIQWSHNQFHDYLEDIFHGKRFVSSALNIFFIV